MHSPNAKRLNHETVRHRLCSAPTLHKDTATAYRTVQVQISAVSMSGLMMSARWSALAEPILQNETVQNEW